MKNIAVFASGTGTNFIAIHEAIMHREIDAHLGLFFSDKKTSKALKHAQMLGLNAIGFELKEFPDKTAYETELIHLLDEAHIDLIILAGYMKIIGSTLLKAYEGKIINIHPSLLPAYRGKDAIIRQHKNQVSPVGISIHYVDSGIDTGKIIYQHPIPIKYPITLEEIEHKIHHIEHLYYKIIINQILKEMES